MNKILVMNAGSSSVKWKLFTIDEKVVAKGSVERILLPASTFEIKYADKKYEEVIDNLDYETAAKLTLSKIEELSIAKLDEIIAVVHRVVAGGQEFTGATKVDDKVLQQIKDLSDFAPLHNPNEASYIELMKKVMPNTEQFAVFDSVFFKDMPEINAIYGLPVELTRKYGIRRYGEHGISHSYLTKRAAELLDKDINDLNIITLHLGGGASVAAVKNGKSYDSSMGFTPVAGLTMGTRVGDLDPSVVGFLMEKENLNNEDITTLLNDKSGLFGICGYSDMRDVEAHIHSSEDAKLARVMFINRVVKFIGAYYAELGRVDAVVFSGGIGENNVAIREEIINQVKHLGFAIDSALNKANNEGIISPTGTKIKTMVIPTNEELTMVREVKKIL